ncbi:hypothetical protein [Sphingobacterium suaedae]|uniref:DUF4890 domain-containing protein n=1 Tax=Sphingobacterium suaedae TaxID=1686402 RepID=A0ABW5KDW6_9SPHI
MKNLQACIICLILGISISFAQERQGRGNFRNQNPEQRAKQITERLTEALKLEKSQQDSIYKYAFNQATDDKIVETENGDREALRQSLKQNRDKYNNKIKSFLTSEQQQKYEELQKQRTERRPRKNQ